MQEPTKATFEPQMDPKDLLYRHLVGEATPEEVEELDRHLAADPELRKLWIVETNLDTELRKTAEQGDEETHAPSRREVTSTRIPWAIAAACIALLAFLKLPQQDPDHSVATLTHSENAAWESELVTIPGSRLPSGKLNLRSGLATILFHSGAELTLEAPAELVLKNSMEAELLAGAAIMDVPEQAIGFKLQTPDGYAIDHGTRFAVRVGGEAPKSHFEVLEGEISVHLPKDQEKVHLFDRESATIHNQQLILPTSSQEDGSERRKPITLTTQGECISIIGSNKRKFLKNDALQVKLSSQDADWNSRSLLTFDLSQAPIEEAENITFRMNQVHSDRGYASRLPEVNEFTLYGFPGKPWDKDSITWENAPQPEEGTRIGSFTIPRSQQEGRIWVGKPPLFDFLKAHANQKVTFLLVRDTSQIPGDLPGLAHTFATDAHPDAAGPRLLLKFAPETPLTP